MSDVSNANSSLKTLGIVLIVLGLFCAIFASFVSAMIAWGLGIALTIGGGYHGYHTFRVGGPNKNMEILISLVTLLAGLFMVFHPVKGINTLVQIAMLYFLIGGVFDIVVAFTRRASKGWQVPLVIGLLNIIFAVILISRAEIGAWLLGVLIGINLILKGSILVSLSTSDRYKDY